MSREANIQEVADTISDLSAYLATWISDQNHHGSLARAIEASLESYEEERGDQVEMAGKPTSHAIDTGSVARDLYEWAKWGVQKAAVVALDNGMTNSAAYFRKNYPSINNTNAYDIFKSLELAPGGWAREKHAMFGFFGRPSLKTRMVSATVDLSFETATSEADALKGRVRRALSLLTVDGQAQKLYTEMLGAIAERLRAQKQPVQAQHGV